MIGVGCARSLIIFPDGRASWHFNPFWFSWNICPDSAANNINSFGNVFSGGGCVGISTPEVPPAWIPFSLRLRRYAGGWRQQFSLSTAASNASRSS